MRQDRHVDRPGHVEGEDICERQIDDGGIKQQRVQRDEDDTQDLCPGTLDVPKGLLFLAGGGRCQQNERTDGADRHHLPHTHAGDEKLAERVAGCKEKVA